MFRPSLLSSRRGTAVFILLFLTFSVFGAAAQKVIHLRNEQIVTPPRPAVAAKGFDAAVSRLILVQFDGAVQSDWLAQLRAAGVEPLRYVPEHAFVGRVRNVRLSTVRALPFVRWVGAFQPSHKLHPALKQAAGGEAVGVSVLLAPNAPGDEIAAVRRRFQRVHSEIHLRFGAILRGQLRPAQLTELAESDSVLWVEPGAAIRLFDEVSTKIVGGEGAGHFNAVQELGFDGRGVTVAVADSGLHNGQFSPTHPDLAGRIAAFFHYGDLFDASDEHSHGTHVTGIIAGDGASGETDEHGALYGLGVAPGARIVAQRIFDGDGNYEAPPSFETLTRDAVQAGAEIGSNSWGDDTQGRYDISAAEFDALVRDADALTPGDQPYILEFSAGNAGPGAQTIGSPAVAKNVIATGASQNDRFDFFIYEEGRDAMADFSSRGPCEDGRIKPDLTAPGTWIASLRSPLGNDENAWAPISDFYLYQGGTSQAGPQVSGAAAVFVQFYRQQHTNATPSPALVKAALINSATDMDDEVETEPTPNMDEGWGRVDLETLIASDRVFDLMDQDVPLRTGQRYERRVIVSSSDLPLIVTVAYTDVPGFPGAVPALVNDLDLEVEGPDGVLFRGNQFFGGESVPGAVATDTINNVEGIHVSVPTPGEYVVRVIARNVADDARVDTAAVDQDFALAISALLPPPNVAVVLLDRIAYTAPGEIGLRVIDAARAGSGAVTVEVTSSSQPAGLSVTLRPSSNPGSFTGTVATARLPVTADGRLHFAHGDELRAAYLDGGVSRQALARGDLVPPVISGIVTSHRFGSTEVSWMTDEAANAVLRYGTNGQLNLSVTNAGFREEHTVKLAGLKPGAVYQFIVISRDIAGNVTTNDNGGQRFTFTAQAASTVLLVDAYVPDTESPTIPVSTYTDALRAAGATYDVWNVAALRSPPLATLRLYQVVIWRVNDSYNRSSDTITTADQNNLQQYLAGGGSFFMGSMEILSRLGEGAFRRNVLQVREFKPNQNPFESCTDCDEDFGVPTAEGVSGDPITHGFSATLNYSDYPDLEFLGFDADFSDTFLPGTNASTIFLQPENGRAAGMRYPRTGLDSTGRVVFLSFPFDAVPAGTASASNRGQLMRQILAFLVPGLGGVGSIALDRAQYSVPDVVTVEVADQDIRGLGTLTVRAFSPAAPSGVAVTLHETGREGLFRGLLTLVPVGTTAAPGKLPARHAEVIRVEYLDASSQNTLRAEATIDTVAPEIADVEVEVDYEEAVIRWSTSEPTDALVQYGESRFLGRTAYLEELLYDHEVRLTGLTPDRTYYFKVVSRDAARNAATDDNNGALYTLRTLRPQSLPFTDTFDGASNHWTLFTSDDSQATWELGVPRNGAETAAHSPPNAWGSNLRGASIDGADTFLISPALDLTGGNQAKLRFWHSYDFQERTEFDLLEVGVLYIVTNQNVGPVQLAEFGDVSGGWVEEEIDLSPYIGHVVYLIWHYQLLSFEAAQRPGWLVDNVSVTSTNIEPGTLVISNNLDQASFVVTGRLTRNGQGRGLVLSNAPPGGYTVTYGAVPYYSTPAAQTVSLVSGQRLQVQGNYSFADANQNGISDAWEQAYFGSAAPGRTASTDSDGDGMTDLKEFQAGTNPTNSASALRVTLPAVLEGGSLRFQIPTVAGRSYRLVQSSDLVQWTALSEWIRANSSSLLLSVPPAAQGSRFVRIEVRP